MDYKNIKLNEGNNLLVVVGPTCSGKSSLAIEIAKIIGAEIISGDAYQVYKKMDIGTAKVTIDEMDGIIHHMIDVVNYDEEFNVKLYQERVRDLIKKIHSKNKKVILVGGTGLYIDSVIYDYEFDSNEYFTELKEEIEMLNLDKLQEFIKENNIEVNQSDFGNKKRLVNKVVQFKLGYVSKENKKNKYFDFDIIGIATDRDLLYYRINKRVDDMIENGLIEEVKQFKNGYISQLAIGYKEVHMYLEGQISYEEMIELIKQKSRNYAKRQISWFKKEEGIVFYELINNEWRIYEY